MIGLGAHQVINRLATMAPVVDHDPEALVQPLCDAPPALCFSTLLTKPEQVRAAMSILL